MFSPRLFGSTRNFSGGKYLTLDIAVIVDLVDVWCLEVEKHGEDVEGEIGSGSGEGGWISGIGGGPEAPRVRRWEDEEHFQGSEGSVGELEGGGEVDVQFGASGVPGFRVGVYEPP